MVESGLRSVQVEDFWEVHFGSANTRAPVLKASRLWRRTSDVGSYGFAQNLFLTLHTCRDGLEGISRISTV